MLINDSLKRKMFHSCDHPVSTYTSENKLRVTQRAIERIMLAISLRDEMTNQWIRQQTKVVDIMERVSISEGGIGQNTLRE